MTSPASAAASAESIEVPPGDGDRFAGFGVMGLPFASGHVLAMRRFPASSVGPGYSSVWHRGPDGRWDFWQDQPETVSCPRYFATEESTTKQVAVELSWPAETTLRIDVPDVGLTWISQLTSIPVTRVLNAVGRVMPDRAWRARSFLSAMGPVAGFALRAGKVGMTGTSPNGQEFIANPLHLWVIDAASAQLDGHDLGPVGPLSEQARLGDFWIPQRGVFSIGRVSFDAGEG